MLQVLQPVVRRLLLDPALVGLDQAAGQGFDEALVEAHPAAIGGLAQGVLVDTHDGGGGMGADVGRTGGLQAGG